MLESSPRIIRYNINAYNRMFQSGLLSKYTLFFESMYHFYCIAVGYTKFSLGSGGKRAGKPTELLNLNIGFARVDYLDAKVIFLCNNSLLADGSNACCVMSGFCSINAAFVYILMRSKHATTLKPKLIEFTNSDNNGILEGDPPFKRNSIYVDLMLTNFLYSGVLYTRNNGTGKNSMYQVLLHINSINLFAA